MVFVEAAAGIASRTPSERNDGRVGGQESHLVHPARSLATLAVRGNGHCMPTPDREYRGGLLYAKWQPELTSGHAEKTPSLAFVLIPCGQAESHELERSQVPL